MITLCVRRIELEDGRFVDRDTVCRRSLRQILKVGRQDGPHGNDIVLEYGWVSAYHGLIYVVEGASEEDGRIGYRDLEGREGEGSTFGSSVIRWKRTIQGQHFRNRDVRLDPRDWIVFSRDGRYGAILVPYLDPEEE